MKIYNIKLRFSIIFFQGMFKTIEYQFLQSIYIMPSNHPYFKNINYISRILEIIYILQSLMVVYF